MDRDSHVPFVIFKLCRERNTLKVRPLTFFLQPKQFFLFFSRWDTLWYFSSMYRGILPYNRVGFHHTPRPYRKKTFSTNYTLDYSLTWNRFVSTLSCKVRLHPHSCFRDSWGPRTTQDPGPSQVTRTACRLFTLLPLFTPTSSPSMDRYVPEVPV